MSEFERKRRKTEERSRTRGERTESLARRSKEPYVNLYLSTSPALRALATNDRRDEHQRQELGPR
jgi:hypothetical protein